MIRPVEQRDANAIAAIYNHYINETIVTFEYDLVDPVEVGTRITSIVEAGFPYLVDEDSETGEINGYAYAIQYRKRTAYRFTAESTIYLRDGADGRGIGRKLYSALFDLLRKQSFRSVIAGISLPNAASQAIHKSFGFRKVGLFEQIGYKFDRWIDVEFWQLNL